MVRNTIRLGMIGMVAALALGGASAAKAQRVVLVEKGAARAVIVIPDEALPVVYRAAEELQYHVRRATGAQLEIVAEGEAADRQPHRVYLGDTRAAQAAGLTFPGALDPADEYEQQAHVAFALRTVGPDLFLAGSDSDGSVGNRFQGTRHGTLFAVYKFLEMEMGVRWLWPGELGEVIPARTDLAVGPLDRSSRARFAENQYSVKYQTQDQANRWHSPEQYAAYAEAQATWLLRHRMNVRNTVTYSYGHYFYNARYVERFLATRPDFFQQLPDGTRGYMPGLPPPHHAISMCVSNPDLHRQMVRDWVRGRERFELAASGGRTGGEPFGWMVNACENDSPPGNCACPACRAWDAPDPRFENHAYWSDGIVISPDDPSVTLPASRYQASRRDAQGRPAPSLSDRYARFYLAVQAEAEKVDPRAVVFGYAYANYRHPPTQTRLNDRIVISMVHWPYFPWTDHDVTRMRSTWERWQATGARLVLRPNTMLSGDNYPIFLARKIGEVFAHHAERGMVATSFDSLTGQWASRGPDLYVLTRMHTHPEWPVEDVLHEYYAGFGPAQEAVRRYFEHWERVSDEVAEHPPAGVRPDGDDAAEGGGWAGFRGFPRMAPLIFTPDVMTAGRALIERALAAASVDATASRRVGFLEKGLTHAELTLAVARAYAAHEGDPRNAALHRIYADAMRRLVLFRRTVAEPELLANVGYLADQERRSGWDHSLADRVAADLADRWRGYFRERAYGRDRDYAEFDRLPGVQRLDGAWRFRSDSGEQGTAANWQAEDLDDAEWTPVGVDAHWQDQGIEHGGIGWYRIRFRLPEALRGRSADVSLFFGAVDSAARIWLNGWLVAERPPSCDAWQEPFLVAAGAALRSDRPNTLVVRVDPVGGKGGIWKPVWLVSETP